MWKEIIMDLQITTLPNGMRIVTDHVSTVDTVSLGVFVRVGSRYETLAQNGTAHFLEHMAFKGTKRRRAVDIAQEIENVGGYLNAYTSREATAYYARILKDDIGLVVDILADILQNSTFDPTEFNREREVILQEIGQSYDTPDDIVYDYFQETAYPNQPMGCPILGPASNIKALSRETLMDFMSTLYAPERMVVSAAGNVNHQTLVNLVQTHFGNYARRPVTEPLTSAYEGGDFREERALEQLHVLLGFKGVDCYHDDMYTASVFATLMGGGMASRLFQEIREKRGLVYSIYAFTSSYQDTGLFGVYAGTNPTDAKTLMEVILEEFHKVKKELTLPEIDRAKAQIKAGILMGLESMSGRSKRWADNLLTYDRLIPIQETLDRIQSITPDQLSHFAGQLFTYPLTLAAVGPTQNLPRLP